MDDRLKTADFIVHQATSTGEWVVMGRNGFIEGPFPTKNAAKLAAAEMEAGEWDIPGPAAHHS